MMELMDIITYAVQLANYTATSVLNPWLCANKPRAEAVLMTNEIVVTPKTDLEFLLFLFLTL